MRTKTKLRSLGLLALLGLFAAFPSLISPKPARALGLIETETFYSDATYSHVVGRCVDNSCTGQSSCTGQITDYSKVTTRIC